jgi:hypothetical protein
MHPRSEPSEHTRDRQAGPRVRQVSPGSHIGQGRRTAEISPTARSPAKRRPPPCSTAQGEPSGASSAVRGAPRQAHRRAWRHGGSTHRQEHDSGHGVARGAASEHRETERVRMRAEMRREGARKGEVHGAESSGEERSTPVSHSGAMEAYQGERRQVPATQGQGGTGAKT